MLRMKRLLRTNPSDSSPALPKPARMRYGFGAWEQTLAFVEKNAYPFRLPPGNSSEFQATGPSALKNRVFQRIEGAVPLPGRPPFMGNKRRLPVSR